MIGPVARPVGSTSCRQPSAVNGAFRRRAHHATHPACWVFACFKARAAEEMEAERGATL
jgi:hypothetical protein